MLSLGGGRGRVFAWLCVCVFVSSITLVASEWFKPFNVSYDHRALILDGHRRFLISAGIHYPRSTPEMWPDLIAKTKEGGADVIETYVFWNGHEPVRGQYNFEGRYDLVKFAKLVASNGLYFFLRIGPYACAEWNFGGFPVWLRDIPGIEFRTNNEPFKVEMKRFVSKVVDLMREEKLFSWQGGPIILLQIENEYGNIESSYGNGGKEYIKWAANMALSLGAGVPWVMCRQTDAPYEIIDTCNAYYCDGFKPNSRNKPTFWTENWDGWYTQWGERLPHRPVEDLAFAVARFFQRGGSLQNYYMYYGGTNFGRTAGGPLQITSYDYDAPIDEYGLLNEPKWGHLKDLHAALKLCEPALVAADSPTYIKLGPKQEAHVYQADVRTEGLNLSLSQISSKCSAFLANIDEHKAAAVTFHGQTYIIPPWSVSILPDCRNVAFNTAKVGAQTSVKLVGSDLLPFASIFLPAQQFVHRNSISNISKSWMTTKEPINIWSKSSFTAEDIWEHLNVTKDQSDYLWYSTRIYVSAGDILFWKENSAHPKLTIDSVRDILRVFVNGQLVGTFVGHWVKVVQTLQLQPGYNNLTLLSQTVGLQNYGAFIEKDGAGIRGTVKITGFENGHIDLLKSLWTYQVGLQGEFLKYYNEENENAEWVELTPGAPPSTFTWYKTYFDVPGGNDPVALDFGSMGKGQVWVNGHHIGRYWTRVSPKSGCERGCDYRGAYDSDKCLTNCGKPTQTLYHVPRSWLKASNNFLVILEETGGNPFGISVKLHSASIVCAQVTESHNPPLHKLVNASLIGREVSSNDMIPEMQLRCRDGHIISSITFASFGTPEGSCQSFSRGNCHAPSSTPIVSKACLGERSCSIKISSDVFGDDPCEDVAKTLSVEARCTSPSTNGSFQL
ncbi:beta-galactosidase 9 [Vicia villosa]|uniref:beta-galactosidase 9 n=1 Tax=Vicia villosa TaxID=3911 RepID=UPI00273B4CE6|nr:beta-galactosidase 9 [Vicia villosa]